MTTKDPYDILGVKRSSTADEIKRAYRRLVKESHPDHNPGDKSAERRFKEIQAAYEVLGDSKRREQYDRYGAGGPAPDFHQWSAGHAAESNGATINFESMGDLNSIFEQFFRRSSGRQSRRREPEYAAPVGENIEHVIQVAFEESVRGTTRDVTLQGFDRGAVERIEVKIPAGISDGQTIRLKGRGNPGPGGRGDLLIRVQILPHHYFRREGLDVYLDLPLTVPEAVLGSKIDIPTPDGPARLVVPPGASSGAKLRLRERGVRDARSGQVGDLFAVIKIVVPREPSSRLRSLMEEAAGEFGPNPRGDSGWPV